MVENSDFIKVYKTKKESLPRPLLKLKQVKKQQKSSVTELITAKGFGTFLQKFFICVLVYTHKS